MAYLPFSSGMSALICGNNWDDGVHCGPRTVNLNNNPWNVNVNIGARLACDKINGQEKAYGINYGFVVVIHFFCVRLSSFGNYFFYCLKSLTEWVTRSFCFFLFYATMY